MAVVVFCLGSNAMLLNSLSYFIYRIQEERGRLIGLVSCPVTWWRGEWVGLTLGISLLPILKNLFQHHTNGFDLLKLPHYTTSGTFII